MELPQRKPIRLPSYDYSTNGAYFITVCTHKKQKIFWKDCRVDPCGQPCIVYSELGEIAQNCISVIEEKFNIVVDKYAIMPDHIHLLISMSDYEKRLTARVNPTISQVVGAYKSIVSNEWLTCCKEKNKKMGEIWQRSFFDHVIRGPQDYEEIWHYIDENPLRRMINKTQRSSEHAENSQI